ncbi:hypothetical protein ES703_31527 [subsurface metagenome]
MHLAGNIVFIVILVAALFAIPLGIPGTFVIFLASLIYGVITHFTQITQTLIWILLGIALFGELMEYFAGIFGAKKFGSSKAGIIGAIVGGILGGIVGTGILPLVGSIIGLLIGAFLGAFLMELIVKKKPAQALRAGWGTFTGRIGGILTKVILGIVMIILVLVRIF